MLLQANNIGVNFGGQQVLEDVSIKLTPSSKLALIGANGAGKSSLLKCLMGEIDPQDGVVSKTDGLELLCLTQNPQLTPGRTLEEELYSVFENSTKFQPYEIDANIGQMLLGLGFKDHERSQKVETFSGGWQMRINLAKVLLQEADILLMDEPTNHLDLQAVEWLENFLTYYPKGYLVVSHDRRFMDQVVTEVAELERGRLTLYTGNYSEYQEQRAANRAHLTAAAARQQKSLAKQREFIDKFKAKATKAKAAKSKEKQLAKVEIIEAPKTELKKLKFQFPMAQSSNREVLEIKNLSKSFDEKVLFKDISAELEWTKEEPQRVFILGENGCGKTTLFKILTGAEQATSGSFEFGHKVQLGYYAQHQLQILDPKKSVLKTLEEVMPPTPESEIRGILGRFLFSKDQVYKDVEILSGGEKARLAIAKLMVGGPNTLLLDEPTNHLDTPAQEAIEAAIQSYQGSVICVSHDRYLIENNATAIWEFFEGSLITFKGSYEDYQKKRKQLIAQLKNEYEPESAKEPEPEKPKTKTQVKHEKHIENKQKSKELKKLERELKQLNEKRESLEIKLNKPEVVSDHQELEKISKQISEVEEELMEKEALWLDLSEAVQV